MNKKDKIIVALLFAALFGFLYYNSKNRPTPKPPPALEEIETGSDEAPADRDPDPVLDKAPLAPPLDEPVVPPEAESGRAPTEAAAGLEKSRELDQAFADLRAAEPVILTVADRFAVTIDPEKGGIVRAELFRYLDEKDSPNNMVLGDPDYPMLAVQQADRALPLSHARILEQTDSKLLIERQILGRPLVLEQSWETHPDSYKLKYRLTLRNIGEAPAKVEELVMNAGFMPPLAVPKGLFSGEGMTQGVQYLPADSSKSKIETVTNLHKYSEKKTQALAAQALVWVSVQNKFFVALISGELPMEGLSVQTPAVDKTQDDSKDPRHVVGFIRLPDLLLSANEDKSSEYDFYLGPKKYENLKELGLAKQQVMQFDRFIFFSLSLMEYISLVVFWMITWLVGLVSNYGVAIILTTIVIRTLFWPVTHKTTVWSQKMKEIQPEMQALRKKYEKDPQTMNQKTMELYRKYKVNPFGGCLPMFFQIPVFFALFNVLRSAIALRHAEFLWVSDLSMPDSLFMLPEFLPWIGGQPFNLLPFIMGAAMYMQQRLMPTSADPMQQKMMGFMSVFIVFVCYSMPAGLTLYWTVSNFYTIFQYQVIHAILGVKKKKVAGEEANATSSYKDKPKKK